MPPGEAMRQVLVFASLAMLVFSGLLPSAQPDAAYDLVLRNGRIVDGAGNPWFYGDVAIKSDKIAAVGRVAAKSGKREIDAKGLIVAPGFIDMHSHSDFTIFEDGNAQSKIRQGVTTEVLGESTSPGPYQGKLAPPKISIVSRSGNRDTTSWTTLGGYFDTVEKAGVSTNIVSHVGLANVWRSVIANSDARPTRGRVDPM